MIILKISWRLSTKLFQPCLIIASKTHFKAETELKLFHRLNKSVSHQRSSLLCSSIGDGEKGFIRLRPGHTFPEIFSETFPRLLHLKPML
jgi:hypothetical protein